jgi:hypothetical protein
MSQNFVPHLQQTKPGFALHTPGRKQNTTPVPSEESLIGGLVSEMRRLLRTSETRNFSPPYTLVITDDRGGIAFKGEVSQEGKVLALGHFPRLRRSHFPANAFLTDCSLCLHSFRIDLDTSKTVSH